MSDASEKLAAHRVTAWTADGAVTAADDEARVAESGPSVVEQPGVELLGEPSPTSASSEPTGDVSEVPSNAGEVVAWIREGAEVSEDEASRRAGLAWSVEARRDGGVRTTVEAEVDKHLVAASDDDEQS